MYSLYYGHYTCSMVVKYLQLLPRTADPMYSMYNYLCIKSDIFLIFYGK